MTATRFCSWCGDQASGLYCAGCGKPTAPGGMVQQEYPPREELRDDGQPIDPVGVWRYIFGFLLAGFIGLWIQYWTRYYGWRGLLINTTIFGILVVIFALLSVSESQSCYDSYGNYIC